MTIDRQTISKILFALSVPLTAMALLCFALPIIGTVTGSYEEGMDGIGFYFFYALSAAPAAALIVGGIWLRGWKDAKFGKILLLVLFAVPAAIFAILLAVAIIQNSPEKKEPIQLLRPTEQAKSGGGELGGQR